MAALLSTPVAVVAEAWGMIERAEPGDALSVGVALDYVMDGCGCERLSAKTELWHHAVELLRGMVRTKAERKWVDFVVKYMGRADVPSTMAIGMTKWQSDSLGPKKKKVFHRIVDLCIAIANNE